MGLEKWRTLPGRRSSRVTWHTALRGCSVLLSSAPVVVSRNEVALPGVLCYPLAAQDKRELPFKAASLPPLTNTTFLSNLDQMLRLWWRKSKQVNPALYFTQKFMQTPLISVNLQQCVWAENLKQQILVSWSPSRLWAPGRDRVNVFTFLGLRNSEDVKWIKLMSPL